MAPDKTLSGTAAAASLPFSPVGQVTSPLSISYIDNPLAAVLPIGPGGMTEVPLDSQNQGTANVLTDITVVMDTLCQQTRKVDITVQFSSCTTATLNNVLSFQYEDVMGMCSHPAGLCTCAQYLGWVGEGLKNNTYQDGFYDQLKDVMAMGGGSVADLDNLAGLRETTMDFGFALAR